MASGSDTQDTPAPAGGELPQADPAAGAAMPAESLPPPVIRGESPTSHLPSEQGNPQAAITDYLNFTYRIRDGKDPIGEFWEALGQAVGPEFGTMQETGRRFNHYERSFVFERGGVMFGIGGQNNTALLSIPGEGCALVPSWRRLKEVFADGLGARISRWDGAVDDFAGHHSVDEAVELYKANQFTLKGRRPSCNQRGNWIEPDGTGRTFYVGKRENGKLFRAYEKGMQLGVKWHPWVRWEVQLGNKDRVIPWEVLFEPGRYVAGAYPATAWVSEDACRIKTLRAQDAISYDTLVHHGSVAYGQLVDSMLKREGSAERVVQKLTRPGVPRRLALTEHLKVYRVKPE